jgi:hypothetical protein
MQTPIPLGEVRPINYSKPWIPIPMDMSQETNLNLYQSKKSGKIDFREIDTNGDGDITLDELKTWQKGENEGGRSSGDSSRDRSDNSRGGQLVQRILLGALKEKWIASSKLWILTPMVWLLGMNLIASEKRNFKKWMPMGMVNSLVRK